MPKPYLELNSTLLKFSQSPVDEWKLIDALRGVQIFGAIGSGKSSGSGRTIAKSYLSNGMGGLVLCAKPDESKTWEALAKEAGRTSDLIIVGAGKEHYFNPLSYEVNRGGEGAGETYNLVNLFMQIYQMGRLLTGGGLGSDSERFWDTALKRCMGRLIDLLKLAKEEVSVANMQTLLTSAPTTEEVDEFNRIRLQEDKQRAIREIDQLAKANYFMSCYFKAHENIDTESAEEAKHSLKQVSDYFLRELANLSEKTKTVIVESFLGIAEPFLGGILKKYFATQTTIRPEVTFEEGKIIVLDFPIKNYLEAGVYAQGIFKLLWQQAIERRDFKSGRDIPAFLWVDESQMFVSNYDQIFQTTARSSGACTVYITQNISNYYAAIGGNNSAARVDSLVGNLSTKIFHANNDSVTNEWAARVIGKDFIGVGSISSGEKQSVGLADQLHFQVDPIKFTTLATGGPDEFIVEGFVTLTGKKWSNGKNHLFVKFNQK